MHARTLTRMSRAMKQGPFWCSLWLGRLRVEFDSLPCVPPESLPALACRPRSHLRHRRVHILQPDQRTRASVAWSSPLSCSRAGGAPHAGSLRRLGLLLAALSLIGVRVRVRGLLSCGALRARTSQSPGSLEFDSTYRTTTGARAPDRHPRAQAALRAHQLYSPL